MPEVSRLIIATAMRILTIMFMLGALAGLDAAQRRSRDRAQPMPVTGEAPEPVNMDTINRRWNGARCQIRIPVVVPKGKGWVTSDGITTPTLPGEKKLRMRLSVSDQPALQKAGYLRQNKEIRVGTAFIARGWRFKDPKRQRDLVLDLDFEGVPVKAAVDFEDNDDIDNLEEVERVMRFEIFQISAPAAAQAPSPFPTLGAGPAPAHAPAPAVPASGSGQVIKPAVKITAVSVQPAAVKPGGEVDMVVVYSLEGIPDGFVVEVRESRRLTAGETAVGSFEETVNRAAGSFTSSQKAQVPAGGAPGIYTVRIEVTAAGQRAEGSAIFQVR